MDGSQFDTPFAAEFLASCLSQLMVLGRDQDRRWTKSRIADSITHDPDIAGTVSDTTIGRLLDPSYKQEPSAQTLAAVAAFLIKVRVITADQLAAALKSRPVAEAVAFAALFPRPQTEAYRTFLLSCGGCYTAVEARSYRFLSVDLVLRPLPESGAILAQEVMILFDIANMERLKRDTRNFAGDGLSGMPDKLRIAGAREIASFAFGGAAVATPDIMAMFLRGQPHGFHGISSATVIDISEDGGIAGLVCERNSGWSPDSKKRDVGTDAPLHRVVQDMVRQLEYRKQKSTSISKYRQSIPDKSKSERKERDFFKQDRASLNIDMNENEELNLIDAIQACDLDSFKRALEGGVDPNQIEPKTGNPLIFGLAADGRIAWVEALLATRRCDLTRVDADGHRSSFAPAVTARMFAPTGPAEIVDRFARLAQILQNEELRQLAGIPGQDGPTP